MSSIRRKPPSCRVLPPASRSNARMSLHAPQSTQVTGNPCAARWYASASRNWLAAPYGSQSLGAEGARARREQHEHVQRLVARKFVQHPASMHFCAQCGLKLSRSEARQNPEADFGGCVHHAADGSAGSLAAREQRRHRIAVGDVATFIPYGDAARAKRANGRHRRGGGVIGGQVAPIVLRRAGLSALAARSKLRPGRRATLRPWGPDRRSLR